MTALFDRLVQASLEGSLLIAGIWLACRLAPALPASFRTRAEKGPSSTSARSTRKPGCVLVTATIVGVPAGAARSSTGFVGETVSVPVTFTI